MFITKKEFPKKLFVQVIEDGSAKYFLAETDFESADDGALVAIYERKEILKKKVMHSVV